MVGKPAKDLGPCMSSLASMGASLPVLSDFAKRLFKKVKILSQWLIYLLSWNKRGKSQLRSVIFSHSGRQTSVIHFLRYNQGKLSSLILQRPSLLAIIT